MSLGDAPTMPEFVYDAARKIAIARGAGADGRTWTLEFRDRYDDDSMAVVVRDPSGATRQLRVSEDDFTFGEGTVGLRPAPDVELRMPPLYVKKLRGFTRGNIPTPDIPGPSLP